MISDGAWARITLKEAGVSLIDCDHRTPTAQASGYPYIAIPQLKDGHVCLDGAERRISKVDFCEWTKKLKPQQHDVIVVRRCNSGDSAVIPAGLECAIGQNLVVLRADGKRVYPPFLRWLVRGADWWEQVRKYINVGAVFDSLKCREIPQFELTIPPLTAQREIAEILRALDDRITLLRETNATLEAVAQALFKSWFVDFDPVHAKQQGRLPEGMDEATAALFPDGFEETELGAVPKGWCMTPFGQLITHTIGGDWGGEAPGDRKSVRVAIIRGTDIPDLKSGSRIRVPIRYTSPKKLKDRQLQHGDIVLEVSGGSKEQPTGRSIYVTSRMLERFDCPVEPASFCRLLRPASESVGILLRQHLLYIYAQGKTWEYQNQSTGIANFQTGHFLGNELVTTPSQPVLDAFVGIVRPIIERAHLTQIQQLASVRDALLPRLISGQLRLPEAEGLIHSGSAA